MTLPTWYAPGPITTGRRISRDVASWSAGTHFPAPYLIDARWFCHDCGRQLRTYSWRGERRLRHYSRARARYNGAVGSSDEPNRISSDARASATTGGAGVVSSIEVVAR